MRESGSTTRDGHGRNDQPMSFGVLGPVLVHAGGRDLTPTRSRLRELLALLLVRPNTAVSSGALIRELYADRPPDTAVTALQVHVSQLRKVLLPGGDPQQRLRTVRGGYLLRLGPDELDLHRFEALAAGGDRLVAAGRPARAAVVLREALQLWRGPALADATSPVLVEVFAPRAAARRLAVLESCFQAELNAGASGALVPELRSLVAEHPLQERLRGQLILALYRAGRQADALAELEELRVQLRTDLHCAPCAELQTLHQRILAADPELRGHRHISVSRRRHGIAPAQLPGCAPRLIGRDGASATLLGAFDTDRVPRGVIGGGAGTGTTALTLSVAHRIRDRFPDGQLFARVGGTATPAAVFGSFLVALGHRPDALPRGPGRRAARLLAELADRSVLLVLDDVPAGWGTEALAALPPGSALLANSAGTLPELGPAARRVRIGPLSQPDALALLAAGLGAPRIRQEIAAAREIVDRCGRLPLALRIVAARAAGRQHWTLRTIVAKMSAPAGLLAELVAGDLCVRESLLRRYERCDDAQRRAFRLLAAEGPERDAPAAPLSTGPEVGTSAASALADTGLLDIAEITTGATGYRMSPVYAALAAELLAGDAPAGRVGDAGGVRVRTCTVDPAEGQRRP